MFHTSGLPSMAAGCLIAVLVLAPTHPIVPAGVSGADPVSAFNSRALGSPGVRRVRLELQSNGATTRSFEIVHAWSESHGAVSSIVLLDAPETLRGTSYLWFEDQRRANGLSIFLRLPAGARRVLAIEPSRFDEGLLGSDFSYLDLLWRIPTTGRQAQNLGEKSIDGTPADAVDSRPASTASASSSPWASIEYYFARDSHLLIGAAYFPPEGGGRAKAPAKTLRVSGWSAHDGVWSPTSMVMSGTGGQRSVLTLLSLQPRTARLRSDLFETSTLGSIADRLEAGAPAASLLERAK